MTPKADVRFWSLTTETSHRLSDGISRLRYFDNRPNACKQLRGEFSGGARGVRFQRAQMGISSFLDWRLYDLGTDTFRLKICKFGTPLYRGSVLRFVHLVPVYEEARKRAIVLAVCRSHARRDNRHVGDVSSPV